MSYKANLADFVTKGKLGEDSYELSQLLSGVSSSQPATKRKLWKKVEQKLKERKKNSAPNIPPPAMEYPSTSLDNSHQSSKQTAVNTPAPSAWFQDTQGNDERTEMKDAFAHDPCYPLPSSSPNAWFSKPHSTAPDHSQSYSSAQALAEYHLHCQDLLGSSSLSGPGSPLGKSEPPAACSSASAYNPSDDDFPALPVKGTLTVNAALMWGQGNTEPTSGGKGVQHPMAYLEYMKALHAQSKHPLQKDVIPPYDPSEAISLSAAAATPRQAVSAPPDISLPAPPSEEEQNLRGFIQQMTQHQCPGCDCNGMPFEIGAVFEHAEKILVSKKPHSIFKCRHRRCRVYFCPGCMKKSKSATALVPPSACSPGPSTWCCSSARLFFIFLLLCGPHGHPSDSLASLLQDRQVSVKTETLGPSAGSSASAGATERPRRVARAAAGTGYGWSANTASAVGGISQLADKENLVLLPGLFAKLQEAWPSVANSSEFDQDPPELLLAMARRSPLMVKVAELLRNDCVEDVMYSAAAYQAMFDFLRVVVAHPFSAPLVRDPRFEYLLRQTLLPVCFGPDYFSSPAFEQASSASSKRKGKEKENASCEPPQEILQSLASLLSSLTEQSRAVMYYMDPGKREAAMVLEMCQCISDLSDEISRPSTANATKDREMPGSARSSTPSRASTASASVAVRPEEAHERKLKDIRTWLGEDKVAEIEAEDWLEGYAFSKQLAQTAGSAVKPDRTKRIVCELSTLRTSLPEGIFVRHDGSRLDAMKVLIVGPEGTPYENGLFEFDLFCPTDYPSSPPLMLFKTTRSKRKFNPNLYTNGIICLSLLGTWGESWDPPKSTLLQLLVSVQAMIFCAEPLWNEPNMEDSLSAQASDLYNWEMRADTLVFAMSDWLRGRQKNAASGGTVSNVWDEVVGKHFELRWRRILETAIRWEQENDADVDFEKSRLRFIMPEKCAANRFGVGIRRLKGHFAEWARTEEDMALVQIGREEKS
ncbi:ubiquitin-conjugating enzyme [Colletotrichum cereale]|nr:ubiquitin-conjugating enzyme [Colletotrichum cereale]